MRAEIVIPEEVPSEEAVSEVSVEIEERPTSEFAFEVNYIEFGRIGSLKCITFVTLLILLEVSC